MLKLKPINNYVINNLDALIVSGGGNATTTFIEFLNIDLKLMIHPIVMALNILGCHPYVWKIAQSICIYMAIQ